MGPRTCQQSPDCQQTPGLPVSACWAFFAKMSVVPESAGSRSKILTTRRPYGYLGPGNLAEVLELASNLPQVVDFCISLKECLMFSFL